MERLQYDALIYAINEDEPTVCPVHLRFVPCRRCKPGEEKFSTDPADIERTRRFQQGE